MVMKPPPESRSSLNACWNSQNPKSCITYAYAQQHQQLFINHKVFFVFGSSNGHFKPLLDSGGGFITAASEAK
jgi:hypothetical protein